MPSLSTSIPRKRHLVQSPAFRRISANHSIPTINPSCDQGHGLDCMNYSEPPFARARPEPLPAPVSEINFPKESLKTARIVGQIDHKYIGCILDVHYSSSSSTEGDKAIVLIDQHAADERIAVEGILRLLCEGFRDDTISVTTLTKTTSQIVLTREEAETLLKPGVTEIIRRWGIHLEIPDVNGDYVQVTIKAVPTILVPRLGKQQGHEMTRMLKLYLPLLEESLCEVQSLVSHREKVDWERVLRWMPKEMLDLANSKACRGGST